MGERSRADARQGRVLDFPARPPGAGNRAAPFDRKAARQAWRQFARIRGSDRFASRRRPGIAWGWWLGFAGLTVWLVWLGASDSSPPESATAESPVQGAENEKARAARSSQLASASRAQKTTDPDHASLPLGQRAGADGPSEESAATPDAEGSLEPGINDPAAGRDDEPPRAANPRVAPTGTTPEAAEALSKIPQGRSDRPPLGGVAPTGLHVDRVRVGAGENEAHCQDVRRTYSADQDGYVNACFRVVHQRMPEFVLVRWERDGELVRRTWVRIPAAHGWRTRAGLPLRDAFVGDWVVRVMSSDDAVELASGRFTVEP